MTYFNPDVKAQLAFLADTMHCQSFVFIEKQSADAIRKGRPTTKIEASIHKIKDLGENDMIRNAFIKALFEDGEGLVAFLHGNKLAFGKGAELLSQKNVVITARRQPSDQEDTTSQQAKKMRQASPKEVEEVTSQDYDSNTSQSASESMLLDEEPASVEEESDEVESFTNFETIPDEIYQKFLAQFRKLTQPERSERELASHKRSQGATSIVNEETAKTAEQRVSPTQMKSAKQTSAREEGVEKTEKRSTEERARTAAAREKDELAAKKLREFIKTDRAKAENKGAEINRNTMVNQEIDEAILYEMLKNNEISEDAMNKIINCANVDEKFLDELLKEDPPLIDNHAYDKLMNIIAPEK